MTHELGRAWNNLNKVLTAINVFIFGLISLNGQFFMTDEQKQKLPKIPVIANIILLLVLILAAVAIVYVYFIKTTPGAQNFS